MGKLAIENQIANIDKLIEELTVQKKILKSVNTKDKIDCGLIAESIKVCTLNSVDLMSKIKKGREYFIALNRFGVSHLQTIRKNNSTELYEVVDSTAGGLYLVARKMNPSSRHSKILSFRAASAFVKVEL